MIIKEILPFDMDDYLERRGFVLFGRIGEVLGWKD